MIEEDVEIQVQRNYASVQSCFILLLIVVWCISVQSWLTS